jgi:hypothetical protein
MKFRIEKEPPTQEEIDKEIRDVKFKHKSIRIGILAIWIVALIITIYDFIAASGDDIFYYGLFAIFLFSVHYVISDEIPGFIIKNIPRLLDIDPEYCDSALAICGECPALDEYRQKVIASGRKLTNGEYEMMKEYAEKAQAATSFEKLHSPTQILTH